MRRERRLRAQRPEFLVNGWGPQKAKGPNAGFAATALDTKFFLQHHYLRRECGIREGDLEVVEKKTEINSRNL